MRAIGYLGVIGALALAASAAACADQNESQPNPAPMAPTAAVPAPAPSASLPGQPLASLKPSEVPAGATVVSVNRVPLGNVAKIYIDGATGNVSSVLVAPAGATSGKKVQAANASVEGGQLILTLNKTAFDALPQTS